MKILHSSRAILALNGIVLILVGISFFIFPRQITISMFPNIISNPEAIEAAIILRYLMGAGSVGTGLVLYLARISVRSGAKRVLMGSGLGFLIVFFTALYVFLYYGANVPYIALVLYPLLGLLSLYVSSRKYQE